MGIKKYNIAEQLWVPCTVKRYTSREEMNTSVWEKTYKGNTIKKNGADVAFSIDTFGGRGASVSTDQFYKDNCAIKLAANETYSITATNNINVGAASVVVRYLDTNEIITSVSYGELPEGIMLTPNVETDIYFGVDISVGAAAVKETAMINVIRQSAWHDIDDFVRQNGAWVTEAIVSGALPLTAVKTTGEDILDYKIYGASGGVGDYVAPEYKQVHTDTVTIDGIVWDILGYDHDIVYKSDNTLAQHSVTIQAHDVLSDMQYDAKEALFAFNNGLAAGTYHFTVGAQPWYSGDVGKTIQFTLSSALPAGGQLIINNAYNATMVGSTISAFASGTVATATETVTMSEGSNGTDLGTITNGLSQDGVINSIQRALLGSNNWQISAMRQYLNSSASVGSVWFPQTKWDRPPSWAANIAGFLNGMSADFIANLGTTSKTTALNTVTDGGGTEATLDKVFLLSRSEIYAGNEVTGGEGAAYPYYSDFSDLSTPGMDADNNRIKYRNGTAKYWWLRSPTAGYAHYVRYVTSSGVVISYLTAKDSLGVAPACCIPLDDIGKNDWLREKFLKNPSTAYGYEVDMSVSDGTTSTTTPIYVGSDPLDEGEYVDYGAGKIYKYQNLLDMNALESGYLATDGTVRPSSASMVTDYMEVKPGKYVLSVSREGNLYSSNDRYLNYYGSEPNSYLGYTAYLPNPTIKDTSYVFTISDPNIKQVRITLDNSYTKAIFHAENPTPTDPPVPLPALPTFSNTDTIINFEDIPAPSSVEIKYKRRR